MLALMRSYLSQSRTATSDRSPIPFDQIPPERENDPPERRTPSIAVDFRRRLGAEEPPGFGPNERQAERLAFIEHVCGVLIEGRSGRPPVTPWDIFDGTVEDIFDKMPVSDLMPEWAFDLMPKGGFMPDFVLGRAGFVSGCSGFVPAYSSSIAPGSSLGSGYPTNPRSRLDAGDNAFGTHGSPKINGPPQHLANTLGPARLG